MRSFYFYNYFLIIRCVYEQVMKIPNRDNFKNGLNKRILPM